MQDYVRQLMDTWAQKGEQAAYEVARERLGEIEAEHRNLRIQANVLRLLAEHLVSTGKVIVEAEPDQGLDVVEVTERPRLIAETALAIWQNKPEEDITITGQEVLEALSNRGLDLGVEQPLAVIGTVLASADGFTKIARNTFEYKKTVATATEDLPW